MKKIFLGCEPYKYETIEIAEPKRPQYNYIIMDGKKVLVSKKDYDKLIVLRDKGEL